MSADVLPAGDSEGPPLRWIENGFPSIGAIPPGSAYRGIPIASGGLPPTNIRSRTGVLSFPYYCCGRFPSLYFMANQSKAHLINTDSIMKGGG